MKYRKLRIAWSITWGVMATLLCVLWVRSYWWDEAIQIAPAKYVCILESDSGRLSVDLHRQIETDPTNPFDLLFTRDHVVLPWHYDRADATHIQRHSSDSFCG